jgi:tRNA U34 2-thiouridine synthase MnmA/TrmU
MDCHTLMYKLAGNVMKKKGYDFLFSGEVLGQRPMSQTRSSLNYVEKHSGHAGFILRPLSAKKLNQSIPEKNGWVDREQLLSISGRSRKQQIALARKYGISDYPAPAGGCLLTDKGYSARLKDLMDHQSEFTKNELHLLKHGRHLRLSNQTKIIVGRTQIENERILSLWNPAKDIFLKTKNVPGPIVLIPNGAFQEMILIGAEICAGYSKAKDAFKVKVQLNSYDKKNDFTVSPMPSEQFRQYIIQSK